MDLTASQRLGRWALFAPDNKRVEGPQWLVLFAIFVLAVLISVASAHFYNDLLFRPVLGVTVAGLLLLDRRNAIRFLFTTTVVALVSYPFVGAPQPKATIFPLLSVAEACVAVILARRFCGAQLDLTRPRRLAAYFICAVIPATLLRGLVESFARTGFVNGFSDNLATILASHFVSMGLLVPLLLQIFRKPSQMVDPDRSLREGLGLFALMVGTALIVFSQSRLPLLFVALLPLIWISFRTSAVQSMIAATVLIFIASIATAEGWGPLSLVPDRILRHGAVEESILYRLSMLQFFAASAMAIVLPLGAFRCEEARSQRRADREHMNTLAALAKVREGEAELRRVAFHDVETGLPNRVGFEQIVAERLVHSFNGTIHVAALEIDRYSSFRAALGSTRASQLVQQVGVRISEQMPDTPIARLSPSELAIAFYATDRNAARVKLDLVRALFSVPVWVDENNIDVHFIIGVAEGDEASTLVHQAEAAAVQARKLNLDIAFFDAAAERQAASGLTMLSDLRAGLTNGDVWLSFQPKLDLRSGKIHSAETLLRWNHPLYGPVGPDRFIPLAEETGFIDALTDWVVEQAIKGQQALDERGVTLNMAINISARSLSDAQFLSRLMRVVDRCGGDPRRLTLEVTETAIMVHSREALANLRTLRDRGFAISIDDFGIGQSSLAYLRNLPADELKIDQSFICDIAADQRNSILVRATVDLAHSLGLRVVAEGVEDEAALGILTRFGCDIAQGHHVARPMAIAALVKMLARTSLRIVR